MVVGTDSSRLDCRHCDLRTCSGSLHYRHRNCNVNPGICAFVCTALFHVDGRFPALLFGNGLFSQHYSTGTERFSSTIQHGRNVSTTLLNMDGIFFQHYSTTMRCFPPYSIRAECLSSTAVGRNVCPVLIHMGRRFAHFPPHFSRGGTVCCLRGTNYSISIAAFSAPCS